MSDVPDYRYWTAEAIRANRHGGDTVPDVTGRDDAAPAESPPCDPDPPSPPRPLAAPPEAPVRRPQIRPFSEFVAETSLAPPSLPVEHAPVPEPPAQPPPAPGPLRRIARPTASAPPPPSREAAPVVVMPAEAPPTATYRSGYGPRPAVPALPRLPAPPPPRRSARGRLRLLSYLVIVVLAAVAGHLYWPTHTSGPTAAPAADSAHTGVPYSSASGHFRALFPAPPTVSTDADTVLGHGVRLHGAGDTGDHIAVIEADVTPAVAAKQYAAFLAAMLQRGVGPDLTKRSATATTFRGHPAILGAYTATSGGMPISLLAVMTSATRAYIVGAPTGSAMTSLERSFVMLP